MTTTVPSTRKVISKETTTKVEIDSETGIETTIETTTIVEEEEIVNETYSNQDDETGEYDNSVHNTEYDVQESYVLAKFPSFQDIDGVGLEDLLYASSTGPDKRPLIEFSGIEDRSPVCVLYSYGVPPPKTATHGSDTPASPISLVPQMTLRGRWKDTSATRRICGQTDICVIRYEEEEVITPLIIDQTTGCGDGAVAQPPISIIPSFKVHADEDFLVVARKASDIQRRQARSGRGVHCTDRAGDIENNEDVGNDSPTEESGVQSSQSIGAKKGRKSIAGNCEGSDNGSTKHNKETTRDQVTPPTTLNYRTRIYPISAVLEMEMI
eukprot:Tbor_TRINITY_DN5561_c1_g1::TRINITY_DN5561_c1_g1_i1::g.13077::m.13077